MATTKPKARTRRKLTVLSFGGGQDSTAILYALAFDKKFREYYAPDDLLVVMSDTGNEHPMTYLHVILVQKFCADHGIEFIHLTPDMGFHKGNWRSLEHYFDTYDLVMSVFFKKSCTDGLKIQPFYRHLNHWISQRYGIEEYGGPFRTKRALVTFAQRHGKVRVLLGIAKGEESRVGDDADIKANWQKRSVVREYPLIRLGWDRQACQEYIRGLGMSVPPPSNCMMCPFMDKVELLWLARKYPAMFQKWVGYEARKLEKFVHLGERNYCVLHKTKRLPEVLADAEKQYGHWTMDQLERHRFSHGHCVKSKY